jgi:hypothetical protein
MKSLAAISAFLLICCGCGTDRSRQSSAAQEVRHPSNEMVPLKTVEPEPSPLKRAAKHAPAKPPRPPVYEDPRRIPVGINFGDMVRRFGPPAVNVTDSPSRTTFSYSKLKTQVQVEVQNGKVVSVASVNTGF